MNERRIFLYTFLLSVSADTAFYEKWGNLLHRSGTGWDLLRELGWLLVKLLLSLCDACEKLLEYANKSLSFIISPAVTNFINQWKYAIYGVLIIAILIFGINLMVNHKQEKSKLLQNIVISVLVLMCCTTAVIQLTTNTQAYSLELLDSSNSTSAQKVIKDSITDLYYLDSQDFSDNSAQQKNNISASLIDHIDPIQKIKSSDDVNNPDVFSYWLDLKADGKLELREIDDGGLVDFNNDTYYRYTIDFITIFITLLSTTIVMLFTAFKIVKIAFDIIIHHILAGLLAAGDWASGQKIKEVVKSLFALFFSVFMCSVMMKLYFMFAAWTSSNIESGAARGFILFFAAIAVIDGPNIIERIFGVDAGLASTFRSVSTLFFGASGAARVARGAVGAVNSVMRGTAHAGGAFGGFVSTIFGNKRNNAASSPTDGGINGNSKENKPDIANTANNNKNNTVHKSNNTSPNSKSNNATENNSSKPDNPNTNNQPNVNDAAVNSNNPNTKTDETSISNKASHQKQNNGYDYWGNKSRNPRSVTGAAVRGKNSGQYWGDKINNVNANRRERQEAKRNAKGDNK